MKKSEMADQRKKIQQVMVFLGALAHGSEKILHQSTHSMGYIAGKNFGQQAVKDAKTTDNILEGIEELKKALHKLGIMWEFKAWKREDEKDLISEKDGKIKVKLVFSDCIIRNTLFRYAHSQKESLCYMSHGCFVGALEKILRDTEADLEIIHAGQNACLKELTLEKKK